MTTPLTDTMALRRMIGDTADDSNAQNYPDDQLDELVAQASAYVYRYTSAGEAALTELVATPAEDDDPEATVRVPLPEVKRAATVIAAHWLRQENSVAGQSYGDEQARSGGGFVMPTSAMQILAQFRVVGFGAAYVDPDATDEDCEA